MQHLIVASDNELFILRVFSRKINIKKSMGPTVQEKWSSIQTFHLNDSNQPTKIPHSKQNFAHC